jgi:hypothetical protein
MDAAILPTTAFYRTDRAMPGVMPRMINAVEFRKLLVSHRRMVRADRREDKLRGLQDLDTGEIFLTDERRLLEGRR